MIFLLVIIAIIQLFIFIHGDNIPQSFTNLKFMLDNRRFYFLSTEGRSHRLRINLLKNQTEIDLYREEIKSESIIHYDNDVHLDKNLTITPCPAELDPGIISLSFPLQYVRKDDDEVGLGHYFSDYSFSIVHQLYEKGYIKKKQFSIQRNLYVYLYLGEISKKTIEKLTPITFKPIPKIKEWGFTLDSLVYMGQSIYIGKQLIITSSSNTLYVDKKMYLWIRDTLYKDEMANGTCFDNNYDKESILKCRTSEAQKKLTKLKLSINNIEIPLFYQFEDSDVLHYHIDFDNEPTFKLPWMFFYNKTITFDYENDLVTIYLPPGEVINSKIKLYLIIFGIGLCLLIGAFAFRKHIFTFFENKKGANKYFSLG